MSGPQDRVARPEGPDHVDPPETDHPREPRPQQAELRSRPDRLPDGHPSAAYRDDGRPLLCEQERGRPLQA